MERKLVLKFEANRELDRIEVPVSLLHFDAIVCPRERDVHVEITVGSRHHSVRLSNHSVVWSWRATVQVTAHVA